MSHELQVMALRIVGALLIGGMIGLERSFHGRPAGFRTHLELLDEHRFNNGVVHLLYRIPT